MCSIFQHGFQYMAAKSIYIPSFTKTLTLTTALFLFISVDALSVFEFTMVLGAYILLCPEKEEVQPSSWGHRYTHSAAQSSKRFKPLFVTILFWQGLNWKKTQTWNLTVFMVVEIWPTSTLKFLFVFDLNWCLRNLFLKGSSANNFCHA